MLDVGPGPFAGQGEDPLERFEDVGGGLAAVVHANRRGRAAHFASLERSTGSWREGLPGSPERGSDDSRNQALFQAISNGALVPAVVCRRLLNRHPSGVRKYSSL